MRKFLLLLSVLIAPALAAQEYEVPEITVSKDKVRVDGKAFYAHIVGAKQTLYSISKVYGVSVEQIYASNRNLNLQSEGLKIGQVLLIPMERSAESPATPAPAENDSVPASEPEDSLSAGLRTGLALFPTMPEPSATPQSVSVAVLLPFNAGTAPDAGSVDFYRGALLAARKVGSSGTDINIRTYDISGAGTNRYMIRWADVILGPVSEAEVGSAARLCPEGKYIISPLEPKNAALTDSLRVIQVPPSASAQAEDAARWAAFDMAPGDSLVVILEKGKPLGEASAAMIAALRRTGMRFSTLTYDLLSGTGIQENFARLASRLGTTRYLIASEEEPFVNDAIRNINLMAYKKHKVILYGPSKIRSFPTVEAENLHNVSTHISASYQIDYNDPEVQGFVLAYRALFDSEPNSFAFHGYDCLKFFTMMSSRYGSNWPSALPFERARGLQTDFHFRDYVGTGKTNGALRRVIYNPDFTITLQN